MRVFVTIFASLLLLSTMVMAEWRVDVAFGPTGESGQFAAVDSDGKLWVTDYGTPGTASVRVFNADTTEAAFSPITSGLDETGASVSILYPGGVAVFGDTIYVISYSNQLVMRFLKDGTALTGWKLSFSPGDLDIDANGHVFIAHKVEAMFSVFDINGNELKGSPFGVTGWHINRGIGVTADGSKVFLADESSDVIAYWKGSFVGTDSCYFEKQPDFMTGLSDPSACEIDPDGNIWISNTGNNEVLVADTSGNVLQTISGLEAPRGAAFDWANNTAYVIHFTSAVKMVTRLKNIPEVTIAEIQTTADGQAGPSPYVGQVVKTSGIVTAVTGSGYYLQDAQAAWSGIYVYDKNNKPAMGDEVALEAEVAEYYNLTELKNVDAFTIVSSGNTMDPLVVATGDVSQEMYEGVLVQVKDATCTDEDLGYGEWQVDDGSGPARIDDAIYTFSPDSGVKYDVTGVVTYSYGKYKILPRDENDIVALTLPPVTPVDYWKVRFHFGPKNESGQFAALDDDGKLWVTDYGAPGTSQVLVFNPDSTMADFSPITKGLDENGVEVGIANPGGVAYYDSIIYVISYGNKKVLRYKTDGTPLNGWALNFSPGDLDIDQNGYVYIAHKVEAMFSVFDINGNELKGSPFGTTGWHINRGISVTKDGSKVFLADESSDVIAMWEGGIVGTDSCYYAKGTDFMTGLSNPSACEIDAADRMWISNTSANEIIIADLNGNVKQTITVERPRGVAVDYDEEVAYVIHFTGMHKMVSKLTPGVPTTPIAEVKVDADGDFVPDHLGETFEVQGIVTSVNYSGSGSQYYIQDTTAGINLYSGSTRWNLNIGDEVLVKGSLMQYKGLTEIGPTDIWVQSTGNVVEPLKIKIAEMGEQYEGMLVRLDSIWMVDPSRWPDEGSNGSVYVTDGTDTTYIFIDRDTDLDGWFPPQSLMNVVGVHDQYTSKTPPDNGYSIRGRLRSDFEDLVVQLSAYMIDFGSVAINGQNTMSLFIKNISDSDFTLDSLTFTSPYFKSSLMGDTTIAAGDSLEIPVTFMPMAEEEVMDVLSIHLNFGTYKVELKGSGYELFPLVWRIHADSANASWFYQKDLAENMVRGMAYNRLNNHLYVVSRVGGVFVYILDAATGDTIGTLNTEGIGGGTYPINTIACTKDGQIVVSNLAASGGQIARLYYYKNEKAAPQMIFDGTFDDLGGRVGDVVAVSGTGKNLTVYWSGSNNEKIHTLVTTDGETWSRGDDIPLPEPGAGRFGIAPVDDAGNYLFINGTTPPRYIKRDGTVLYTFDTDVVPSGTSINYFEVKVPGDNVRRFIGITNALSSGTTVIELLGEPGDNLCADFNMLEAPTEDYATNVNLNGTGLAVYNSVDNMLIELITNNGISAYSFDVVVPDAIKDVRMIVELNEGFETTPEGQIPDGWLTFADSVEVGDPTPAWRVSDYNPFEGEKNAYMPNYNTKSRCWLVTPAISLNTDLKYFTFMAKDDWNNAANDFGSELNILVSTASQDNPEDFVLVESYPESEFYDSWQMKSIDLSQFQGDYVYIAFMVKNFGDPNNPNVGGDNWQIDNVTLTDTLTAIASNSDKLPVRYELSQNYPNPFNPTTRIDLALPKAEKVEVEVFNTLGQKVKKVFDGELPAGIHRFEIDGTGLASGVYFYRVKAGKFVATKKMVLMK
ncbi:choice-of-anchor J domain-containing protein [Caldithrix abyssi]